MVCGLAFFYADDEEPTQPGSIMRYDLRVYDMGWDGMIMIWYGMLVGLFYANDKDNPTHTTRRYHAV